MPITIPDELQVRVAHDFDQKPGAAGAVLATPGPLSVSPTGSRPDGLGILVPSVAANREGYVGFAVTPHTDQQVQVGQAITALRNTIIAGFAGVEPGKQVFIANDGTLTHTPPAASGDEVVLPIGVGYTASLILLY